MQSLIGCKQPDSNFFNHNKNFLNLFRLIYLAIIAIVSFDYFATSGRQSNWLLKLILHTILVAEKVACRTSRWER